jgi:hypothetical protein
MRHPLATAPRSPVIAKDATDPLAHAVGACTLLRGVSALNSRISKFSKNSAASTAKAQSVMLAEAGASITDDTASSPLRQTQLEASQKDIAPRG